MATGRTKRPAPAPVPAPVRMTMYEAAEKWGVSYTVIRKWIKQGRVKAEKFGRAVVILQEDRPPALKPGSLTLEQRMAWNPGTRRKGGEGEGDEDEGDGD